MPTNLPPQYFDVEKELKTTNDPHEKIAIMEELLSIIPKHKGTEKLQALYKTKIAKLKNKMEKKPLKAKLDVLRVYSKTPGEKASFDEPYVFKKGSTLLDMAKSVHRDFASKLKFARLWSKNQYNGQKINRDYILQDGDIVELHL